MNWQHIWPFQSREEALAHERAYLAGFYRPPGSRKKLLLVREDDLAMERELESEGAARLRNDTSDQEVIWQIYVWKRRATLEQAGQCAQPPDSISTPQFSSALRQACDAINDEQMIEVVNTLTSFGGIQIRAASAFVYWLRPEEYQVIDRRVTSALNLGFADGDYTSGNYIQFCVLSRELAADHGLTLRQIDRALFVYEKLLVDHTVRITM